ncbi:two component transcriptional regulator, LuxR family [Seinonella peptonophila]|uniref:Two component transcriptional regulator, LuxR family n=1 Tax=Seinonella peptonophila TaxID=112248 RepID=A0A1M4XKU8_9BACL|nr:response regulator transcription factor [Seinonella peptonophila]SHE94071.1 two component transcriptional regulator, LuxR family [Seinonella peptonophila]
MIRLLIVDDHEMIRLGLKSLLQNEPKIQIVGEANSGYEAIQYTKTTNPDVILMDVKMAQLDGIQATKSIMEAHPQVKIIVLTSYENSEQARRILDAGAFSYLLKTSNPEKIISAIYQSMNQQAVIDETIAGKLLTHSNDLHSLHHSLTSRELDILKAITQGKSNQQIAIEFHISLATVKYHISNLLSKLQVKDRTQAVIYAYHHGLFQLQNE